MNQLLIFNYKNKTVRTVTVNNETWWVLKDVCNILELTNNRIVADRLEKDEVSQTYIIDSLGRQQQTQIISEAGLYNVILRSDKPEAKEFKRWVTHRVLPSIRKHGGYIAGQETLTDDELVLKALQVAQKKIAEKEQLIDAQKPKVLFADSVETSKTSILIGELAKILKQNGCDIGQNRLFKWLRHKGYLISRRGTDYNMPTQKSMELGLFEIRETTVILPDGQVRITKTSKVTGKGQVYFVNKFTNIM